MNATLPEHPQACARPVRRLIVVGASGLIGGELCAAARAERREVVGTFSEHSQPSLVHFDLRTEELVRLLPDLGPDDVVYLLSAYSNPSWIHTHFEAAQAVNVTATRRLIDAVSATGARLIFMSSVEVFDGRRGDYTEEATPAPLNDYGRMKFEIERHIATLSTPACIVRTGWNVGWSAAHRCVIRLTYESLLAPDAKMAFDNTFSISDVRDTALGLLRLSDHPEITKLHLASSPHLVRRELADLIMAASVRSSQMSYRPVSFARIAYSEPRAQLNHLNNHRAVTTLGLAFRSPEEIVRAKVRLLDAHFSQPTS